MVIRSVSLFGTLGRVLLLGTFVLPLLAMSSSHAQACLSEIETNDTPIEATPFTGMGCVMGTLSAGDQDLYVWTITDEDLQGRQVVFDLEGVLGGLTQALLLRLTFADNGIDVTATENLLVFDTPTGAKVSTEPQLLAAGTYHFGVSAAGGEGRYILNARIVDPYNPGSGDWEPNDSSAEAREQQGEFALSGSLQDSVDYHRWTVTEEDASKLWKLEAQAMPGEELTVELFSSAGELIVGGSVDERKRLALYDLGLEAGSYTLVLGPASERTAPYILRASSQGVRTQGHEVEPNNQPDEANHLELNLGMSGTLSASERDMFSFRTSGETAGHYQVSLDIEVDANLCLRDALEKELLCQSGRNLEVPNLYLPENEYLLMLDGSSQDAPYTLRFTPTEAPEAGYEVEPNNILALATSLDEDLAARGELSGREKDVYTFSTSGQPQLFRVQVLGDGIETLHYYDGGGVEQQYVRSDGSRRVRLDNLVLLPGNHYLEVRGENGDYVLKALSLGPASLDAVPQVADSGTAGADAGAGDDIAAIYPRPAGVLELEPNDDPTRAQLLRLDETYVGTLTSISDIDMYRFSLRNDSHVRLEAMPGEGGQIYFGVGSGLRTDAFAVDESTVMERWLVAGDYFVYVHPMVQSDGYYQLRLSLLDPFVLPDDFEPNDSIKQARPLPSTLQLAGVVGESRDRDWYALPVFEAAAPLTVKIDEGNLYGLTLYNWETEGPLPEEGRDYQAQTYSFMVPALAQTALRVEGQGRYRLSFDFGEALLPSESSLGVTASLELSQDQVAAYWHGGQRLEAVLRLENTTAQEQALSLQAHSSDAAARPEGLPERVMLAPSGSQTFPLQVIIMPDAPDDQPMKLTVAAGSDAGTVSAAATLQPTCEAPAVGSFQSWPLPEALLGSFDMALLAFGAQVVEAGDYVDRDKELFDGRVSPATGPAHDPGQSVVVRLPGGEPFTLVGMLLHPFSHAETANQLKDFEVAMSLDGERYETVVQGQLRAARQEQAFVFDEPIEARYARLTFVSKQDEDAYGQIYLGEWKLLSQTPPVAALNLADPRLGGYVVWSDPLLSQGNPVLTDPGVGEHAAHPSLYTPDDARGAEWAVGFHHNRAARIERLEWVDHDQSRAERRLHQVDVYVSLDSPVGPWTPLATWTLEHETVSDEASVPAVKPLELDEPVWARFVRFVVRDLEPNTYYDFPETIRIFERPVSEDYRSVLGEWGFYSQDAAYEFLNPPVFEELSQDTDASDSRETAQVLSGIASGRVLIDNDVDWYRIDVPEGHNQLTLHLQGDPTIGYAYALQDAEGSPVEAEISTTSEEIVVTAAVEPGSYYLKLEEPPRSIVFSWDTSDSVGPYEAIIYGSLTRFSTQIKPGREEVGLLAFEDPKPRFLRPDWTGDPYSVMAALAGFDRSANSSSAETALLEATQALSRREGTKAVLFITDAESTSYGATAELWRSLSSVKPRVFTFEISSAGSDYSQDLMQSWAAVNSGVYSYTSNLIDFDVGFARATCHLRRPKGYTVSVSTSFVETGPGTLRIVRAQDADAPVADTATLGAVEVVFDASGSMYKKLGDHYRYEIARDVLGDLVATTLPEGVPFALRVFGNREAHSCRTDLEIPLAPLDASVVTNVIAGIEPKPYAGTPIAASLRQVSNDLAAASGPKTVILITDGEESCEGDVAAEIVALRNQDIDVVLNIIGFDFDAADREAARAEFQAWAKLGGGQYFDAASPEELEFSLQRSLDLAFEVIDEAGQIIAHGTVDGEAVAIPAGYYTVRVLTNPVRVFEGISVLSGDSSDLMIER